MRLATHEQMRAIEIHAEKKLKLYPEILMETAGLLAAREVQTSYMPELRQGKVAVICGGGNNGGDGLVLARHLFASGFLATEVFLIESKNKSELFSLQLERVKKAGLLVHNLKDPKELFGYSLYVDAIFGIGLCRPLDKKTAAVIEYLNFLNIPVVSLDLPSGLDGLSGKSYGACVRAAMTLTFGAAKPGLYSQIGAEYAGKIRVVSLGISQNIYRHFCTSHFVVNEAWAKRFLPVKRVTSNKFTAGRLYIRAGKEGTWGAAALACQGAYRMGAGYVTLVTSSEKEAHIYLGKEIGPEVLVTSQENDELFKKAGAIVVGPGAGVDASLKSFILKLIKEKVSSVVVDADGLTILAEMKKENPRFKIPSSWILTPHSGELSRLMDVKATEVDEDRLHSIESAAEMWGCTILLKGFHSIVISSDKKISFVTSGNAALAKAGTGDVLSGFTGALLAQGLHPFEAITTAAYIHGRVADDWVRNGQDMKSFVASDLIHHLPETLQRLSQ